MKSPSASQVDAARRLFEREADGVESADKRAAAAQRVCDQITSHLATLIGATAARALLARSIKLSAPDFPRLAQIPLGVEQGESLGDQLVLCLRGEAPEAVTETAVALFATLLALLGTLIGERLTAKVLKDSWPAVKVSARPKETK